jgi:hypothetical protein
MREPLLVRPSKATFVPSGDTATRDTTTCATLPRLVEMGVAVPLVMSTWMRKLSWLLE